jgi:uncharacterized membrane protein
MGAVLIHPRISLMWKHAVHWLLHTKQARQATSQAQAAAQSHAELHHGLLQVCVEPALAPRCLWQAHTLDEAVHHRAEQLFATLRVWDTAHNNGILIYGCLASATLHLVADRDIKARATEEEWQALDAILSTELREGPFDKALMLAVDEALALLQNHFGTTVTTVKQAADEPVWASF